MCGTKQKNTLWTDIYADEYHNTEFPCAMATIVLYMFILFLSLFHKLGVRSKIFNSPAKISPHIIKLINFNACKSQAPYF